MRFNGPTKAAVSLWVGRKITTKFSKIQTSASTVFSVPERSTGIFPQRGKIKLEGSRMCTPDTNAIRFPVPTTTQIAK